MRATLQAINQMQADGVICHYALCGAVGAAYYSEPVTTLDVEVFVILSFDPNGPAASLIALHDYLVAHRCKMNGECFEIGGWPVHFLAASNDLEREAVAGSLPVSIDGDRTWVMMAEHLVAIALAAHRMKDRPWILRLTEHDAVDELTLKAILKSHGLIAKWAEFEQEYPPQFASKQEMREELAALGFSEKINILERLRDRSLALAASGLRGKTTNMRSNNTAKEGEGLVRQSVDFLMAQRRAFSILRLRN